MPDEVKSRGRHERTIPSAEGKLPFSPFFAVNQQAVAQWLRTMSELSLEVARFAQIRFQEDVAAWSALLACHKPEDAMDCQRRFVVKAAQQYGEEIGKLSQMAMRVAAIGPFSSAQLKPHANA
jgi:hypothetical protein